MESELVQAIQEIAQELNQTTCFDILSLIISFISAIATVSVLWYNHKTIKLAKENMQHSQDLAFYEKMLVVANNIAQEDYSNTDIEIKLLFGKDVLESIQKIRPLVNKKKYIDVDIKKYNELLCEQPEGRDYLALDSRIQQEEFKGEEVPKEIINQLDEFKHKLRFLYSDEGEMYDWEDISKRDNEVTQELEPLVQKVNDDIRNIMEEKFSL